jgi:hypothetical protein
MWNYRLLILVGASIASFFSGLLPAAADQTYNGASIYRDAANTIYKVGVTPSSAVTVIYDDVTISKQVYSDVCGVAKITIPGLMTNTVVTANGANFTPYATRATSSSSKAPGYKCASGGLQYLNFTPAGNSFTLGNSNTGNYTLYLTGSAVGGANKPILISYLTKQRKEIKANACGFAIIKALPRSPFTSTSNISLDRQPFTTVGSLPTNPTPPSCTDGKTYLSSTAPVTYNGSSFYRTTKAIYYTGLAPNSSNSVELNGLASKDVSAYKGSTQMPVVPCGVFRIDFNKKVVSTLKVEGTEHTVATLATTTNLGCEASDLAALTPNTLYRIGDIYNGAASMFVYRTSDATKKKIAVVYPTIFSRNSTVNACGFSEIKSLNTTSGWGATDKVKVNGTEYTVSTLPLAPKAPMCRNGVVYQSAN